MKQEGYKMPSTITMERAQAHLKELIAKLASDEEIVIIKNQQLVAKLVGESLAQPSRPSPGLGKGSILYMAPDFDESLDEFKEYME